jgi:hypothetical protein
MEFRVIFLKVRDIDIVNNVGFKPANLVFQAMLVKLKKEGKGIRVYHRCLAPQTSPCLLSSVNKVLITCACV